MKKTQFGERFSARLRAAFDDRTHTAVANKAGCSRAVITKWLAGDVPDNIELLARIAAAYPIDLHTLITGKPSPSAQAVAQVLLPFVHCYLAGISIATAPQGPAESSAVDERLYRAAILDSVRAVLTKHGIPF